MTPQIILHVRHRALRSHALTVRLKQFTCHMPYLVFLTLRSKRELVPQLKLMDEALAEGGRSWRPYLGPGRRKEVLEALLRPWQKEGGLMQSSELSQLY